MTPKSQVNARLSEATKAKLDRLTERYGTQAEALAVAIDRLYQAECPEEDTMDQYQGKRYLDEMTEGEVAAFFAAMNELPVFTERIVRQDAPDEFRKGPYTWSRTRR